MQRTLLLTLGALFVAAHALPTTLPNTELQHLSDEITRARDDLDSMANTEGLELRQVQVLAKEEAALPNTDSLQSAASQDTQLKVYRFARDTVGEEKAAVKDEDKQQASAVKAMNEVDSAVAQLQQSETKQSLGESASSKKTAMEFALQKLQHVSATLHQGTQTMHTKERLLRMEDESRTLLHDAIDAGGQDPDDVKRHQGNNAKLGESLTPEEAEQHIQDAAIANEQHIEDAAVASIQQVQQQAKVALEQASQGTTAPASAAAADYTPKAGEGALSVLSHTGTSPRPEAAATEASVVDKETSLIGKLVKQDMTVANTEKQARAEVRGLVKDLA